MMLASIGQFGDPSQPLRDLLQTAFEQFKAWRKRYSMPCSQKRFTPNLVVKASHGHYCTAKAHNGRVLLEWLADVKGDQEFQP